MPACIAWIIAEENRAEVLRLFHRAPEDVHPAWMLLCEFTLDCADEARRLIAQFDLA